MRCLVTKELQGGAKGRARSSGVGWGVAWHGMSKSGPLRRGQVYPSVSSTIFQGVACTQLDSACGVHHTQYNIQAIKHCNTTLQSNTQHKQ